MQRSVYWFVKDSRLFDMLRTIIYVRWHKLKTKQTRSEHDNNRWCWLGATRHACLPHNLVQLLSFFDFEFADCTERLSRTFVNFALHSFQLCFMFLHDFAFNINEYVGGSIKFNKGTVQVCSQGSLVGTVRPGWSLRVKNMICHRSF